MAAVLGLVSVVSAQEISTEPHGRALQVQAPVVQTTTQKILWRGPNQPAITTRTPGLAPANGRTLRGPGCAPVVTSFANGFDNLDVGSEITIQAGMVELEGFAATYTVPDPNPLTTNINEAFPVTLNLVEVITATTAGLVGSDGSPILMGWIIDVYDGEPTGNPVYTIESDPDPGSTGLPPDILLDRVPGTQCQSCGTGSASVVKLQFSVDQTAANDQIVIVGNDESGGAKTGRFTVAFRVTKMNNTAIDGSCQFGITHQCGPLKRCENGFMCTEANNQFNTLNHPTRQWGIYRDCGPLACAGGTYRFSELGTAGGTNSACRPSRDVLMQVTYTPASCTVVTSGACCAPAGTCTITASTGCDGTYQGNGAVCAPNPCPQPTTGACCTGGSCTVVTDSACVGGGGVFQGANVACANVNCGSASGACCSTASSFCFNLDPATCAGNGTYQGNGTTCTSGFQCPAGACCNSSGACTTSLSPLACSQSGGTYRGNGTTCDAPCPVASGACCFTSGFCNVGPPSVCAGFPGAVFQGGDTVCSPNPCPQPGVCCRGTTCAIGVTQAACVSPAPGVAAFYATAGASSGCNASGNTSSPCCHANFDKNGAIEISDIFSYLNAWFAGSPYARMAGDGVQTPDINDIFQFLNAWFTGGCS